MCVALPGVVKEVSDGRALVDFNGNTVKVLAGLVPVREGDRVLVHAGCILQKVTAQEADDLADLFRELGAL